MTVRYFVPRLPADGGPIDLPESEVHHAAGVMRIRCGDPIVLFDGMGLQADAVIAGVSRRRIACVAEPAVMRHSANPRQFELGIAMPKGDRAKELVERLTELGVDRLVPLQCDRSQRPVSPSAVEKWRRVSLESCKQCGRNMLMQIADPIAFADFIGKPRPSDSLSVIAHPAGGDLSELIDRCSAASQIVAAVGPEGGFTDDEVDAASSVGWHCVGLGPRIYRIETAAVVLAIKAAGI